MPDLDAHVVASADGTPVEYLSAGRGPHVIVVPGALAMAADMTGFALLLSQQYTVHVVQRRGRGGSGPQGDHYNILRECEDIEAIRAQTGARLIFGHSYGGLAALQAARDSTAFDAVSVYEPGISIDGSTPVDWVDRARREAAAGADFEAFMTFFRGINPDRTGRVPRWLLRVILRRAVPPAEMRQKLALISPTISEYAESGRLDGQLADYKEVNVATQVMRGKGGPKSRYAVVLASLAETIPHAETMVFHDIDHVAPEKEPDQVAEAVLRFFAAHAQADSDGRSQAVA